MCIRDSVGAGPERNTLHAAWDDDDAIQRIVPVSYTHLAPVLEQVKVEMGLRLSAQQDGGLIFLKTLTAEYLCQKYGISIPAEKGDVYKRQVEYTPGAA